MASYCARCNKIVYPTEKINCLDQIWHQACFHCDVCKLKLTMKSYKGYQKRPYCQAHYPTQKFTAVAQTPEQARLTQQTKQQSNISYHAEYEKARSSSNFDAAANEAAAASAAPTRSTPAQAAPTYRAPAPAAQAYNPPAPAPAPAPQAYNPPAPVHHYVPEPEPEPQPVYQEPVYTQPAYTEPAYSEPAHTEPEPEPIPEPMPAPVDDAPAPVVADGSRYRALYSYTATDADEVSFNEGDIINGAIVAEGWMKGTVESSGLSGLLPSNYVEAA